MTTKPSRKGKPFKVATVGNVTVPVYFRLRRGYDTFEVADYTEGRRRLRSFADPKRAMAEAELLAAALSRGEAQAASMRGPERASFGRALELLKPVGLPLELVAANYAKAFELLGGDYILEAAQFFAENNPRTLPDKSVAEVVDALLEQKAKNKCSPRHLADLQNRLGKFAAAFQVPIASVTKPLVQAWLDGIQGSAQTRLNYRAVASNLFGFALARGFVRSNVVEKTERPKPRGGTIETYKPAELARMLEKAPPRFLPALVVAAFTGARTAEVLRLNWADVDLERGHVVISAAKAKTASRRIVPLAPNAVAWLVLCEKRTGPLWDGNERLFYDDAADTAKAAGIAWKANALRHSYATYRLADVKSAAQVALEMGNSPQMVFGHYRELATEGEGKAWFAISPEASANVIPLRKAAK